MADSLRLDDARQAINRVYREPGADPEEVVESLEVLMEDIEMYLDRLVTKLEKEQGNGAERSDGDCLPDSGEGWDLPGERARGRAVEGPGEAEDLESSG